MNTTDLTALGFAGKEAEIYLQLNRLGPQTASTLARLAGIKRTSVYDYLNALSRRGLILSFRQGVYTYYYIDDVAKILHLEQQKVRTAETLVEQLKNEQKSKSQVQVVYVKGVEGYLEMYNHILKVRPREFMAWNHLDYLYKVIDVKREEVWMRERIRKKIFARLILQDTPLARKFQSQDRENYRESILVPKKYCFYSTCVIYDGFVTMLDSKNEISGVRVAHPEIFRLHKQAFEMNWAFLKAMRKN
jgi:sugar-specific transcriptional regulator TrmB